MSGYMAYVIPLEGGRGPVDPGYGVGAGGYPSQPIYHPGHPSHGLPSQPGHPSQPIYHPGHPDHGLPPYPSQGLPGSGGGRPDQSLPWSPESPDNTLPVPPGIAPPTAPPTYKDKLVVLWRMPNTVEWHGKAIDPSASAGQPLPPTPEPK